MAGEQHQQCPLDPLIFEDGCKMGVVQLKAMEQHILVPGNCVVLLHPPFKDLILQGSLKGSSPMLLACKDGNVAVVKHMMEDKCWKVDVNAAATYYHPPYNSTASHHSNLALLRGIERATPLFVAAVNGHVHLVKLLLGKGADVSSKASSTSPSFDDLTPLHGALNSIGMAYDAEMDGSLCERKMEIAHLLLEFGADPSALPKSRIPNWMTNLCCRNMTAVSLLINYGMSLEQQSPSGNSTILHHWIRSKEKFRFVLIKLLIDKGANLKSLNCLGLSPILAAAHEFSADKSCDDFNIFEYLLDREEIDRQEKIDALEMIGAVILGDIKNAHLFEKAFEYWHRAQHLREMGTEESARIYKTVMKRKIGLTEWITTAEMEHVLKDPSQYFHQSYLIILRIYSSKWIAFHHIVWGFIFKVEKGVYLMDETSNFDQLLDLMCAILEAFICFEPEGFIWKIFVGRIFEIMPNLLKAAIIGKTGTFLHFLELIWSTSQLCLVKRGSNYNSYYDQKDNMRIILHLIATLASDPEKLDGYEKQILDALLRLEEPFRQLTQHRRTMLIMACQDEFPNNHTTVRLLLSSGANINLGDKQGNGPLHHILMYGDGGELYQKDNHSFLRFLLDCGAHLDRVNNNGKTAVDLWNEENARIHRGEPPARLPDYCYEFIPRLKCLSARVIRSQKIRYSALPTVLKKFVQMH